jgi:hypothetical protein
VLSCPASEHTGDVQQEVVHKETEIERLLALGYVESSDAGAGSNRNGVVQIDAQKTHPGYSLYTLEWQCKSVLIDLHGNVVNTWANDPCMGHWHNAELLPDGNLLVVDARLEMLFRFDWYGQLVWAKRFPNIHHDVEVTPDGSLTFLRFKRLPQRIDGLQILDCEVVRTTPNGKVTSTLSLFHSLSDNGVGYSLLPRKVTRWDRPELTDLFHANSVEWMRRSELAKQDPIYDLGNVLVSIRHQDSVVILNGEREELLWAWGQGELSGPHDATILDNGHILVFDNGVDRGWSRVVEVDPLRREIVWEYRGDEKLFTRGRGSSQRLPNGNTLISISDAGQLLEVTRDGEVVWEFLNPARTPEGKRWHFARVKRYETEQIERHTAPK